jgi:hypothetical protein
MMTIENGSIWSSLRRSWLARAKCQLYRLSRKSAERFELRWVQNFFGMEKS